MKRGIVAEDVKKFQYLVQLSVKPTGWLGGHDGVGAFDLKMKCWPSKSPRCTSIIVGWRVRETSSWRILNKRSIINLIFDMPRKCK